ncbi:MAG: S1 RNA-binding domain-containing protein [Gemmataceae bacterium]
MTDSEKPEAPAAAPAPEATAPATPPAATSAPTTAPAAAPADARKPGGPGGKPGRGGKGPKQFSGGMPNRRVAESVESLVSVERFAKGPSLKDLDAEIEGDLEAAMSGFVGHENDILSQPKKPAQAEQAAGDNRKQAKIHSIRGADVFLEIPGGRSQAVMSLDQFPEGPPKPGSMVDIEVEGYDRADGLILCRRKGAAQVADWSSVAAGMVVEGRVLETNKGGLAVDVNGIRAFMPISQIDLYRVERPEDYINQRLKCVVTEVNPEMRNLVVSRRELLEKEREELKEKTWAELQEGQIREGIIRSVREFGAFVDLGGVDGLIHVSDMSWTRVSDPTQVVQPGQKVKVVVLKIDREKRKIGLGLKQLQASPWDTIHERWHSLQVVTGKVTRTMEFGAFVELEPGVEGLIHISELARTKVWRVTDVVKPGQDVQVKILSIDPEQRRISLSLKAAIPVETPKVEEEEEEEEETPSKPVKPRTTPLRGGIGQTEWLTPPPAEPENS